MIGQEIARQLDKAKWEIYLYDDYSNPFCAKNDPIGTNVWPGPLSSAIDFLKPDVISHQAAVVGVGESMYAPFKYTRQNALFTAELIQAILDLNWEGRIIHASSMGIFGEQPHRAGEDYRHEPTSFYGLTKNFQEDAIMMLGKMRPGVWVNSLRYFSVYSSTFNPENPRTGILSIIVDQIMDGGPVVLYEDGNQTRDMIHVRDVAAIHNVLANGRNPRETINVCTGRSYTMSRIVEMVCQEFGYYKSVLFNGQHRMGDLYSSKGNNAALRSFYKEPMTPLWQGIREYRQFIEANRDKIKFGAVRRENEFIKNRGLVV